MTRIETISPESLAEVLQRLGYAGKSNAQGTYFELAHGNNRFTVQLEVKSTDQSELEIVCPIATLGDIPEEALSLYALDALAANHEIAPYSFAIIRGSGADNVEASPVALIDSLLVGELTEEALAGSISKLQTALVAAIEVHERHVKVCAAVPCADEGSAQ